MMCPKCKSDNVNVQMVTTFKAKKKSLIYRLLIGWWLNILLWVFLTLPKLILAIFKKKKYVQKTEKQAVCQNCGHNWKLS